MLHTLQCICIPYIVYPVFQASISTSLDYAQAIAGKLGQNTPIQYMLVGVSSKSVQLVLVWTVLIKITVIKNGT